MEGKLQKLNLAESETKLENEKLAKVSILYANLKGNSVYN